MMMAKLPKMTLAKLDRLHDERGVSLVELMVAVMILAVALLGLAGAGGVAAQQLQIGRKDMTRWTAAQQQIEELVRTGYDSVTTGSSVVQGYPMTWTVTGTNPKKILFTVQRTNNSDQVVLDTTVLYFADPN